MVISTHLIRDSLRTNDLRPDDGAMIRHRIPLYVRKALLFKEILNILIQFIEGFTFSAESASQDGVPKNVSRRRKYLFVNEIKKSYRVSNNNVTFRYLSKSHIIKSVKLYFKGSNDFHVLRFKPISPSSFEISSSRSRMKFFRIERDSLQVTLHMARKEQV
jgi:hypothetical protein